MSIHEYVWNYDWVLQQISCATRKGRESFQGEMQEINRTISTFKKAIKRDGLRGKFASDGLPTAFNARNYFATELDVFNRVQSERVNRIRSAHPFLIGPATLESLVDREPDRMDYISEGRLPFPTIYFEFPRTLPVRPIVNQGTMQLIGMLMCLWEENQYDVWKEKGRDYPLPLKQGIDKVGGISYSFEAFFIDNEDFYSLAFSLTPANPSATQVYWNFEQGPSKRSCLLNYVDKKVIPPVLTNDVVNLAQKYGDFQLTDTNFADVDQIELSKIVNSGINIINFINAQNVYIKRKESDEGAAITSSSKRRYQSKPYHIVLVKDEERVEGAPVGKTWELQYRHCVRGHERKLRDKDGKIYKTTWIPHAIKGPPGAPWQDQRHAVFGQKIAEEVELLGSAVPSWNKAKTQNL